MTKLRSPALRGIILLTATGIVSQGVGFFYRILLSHLVGAEVLGLYQLIMPVYSVLLSLTSVGLTASVSYLSARLQAVGNEKAVWQLRNTALRLFFALAALPCGLLLAFSDGASVYLLGDARTQLGLLLLVPCLLLTGVENLQKHYFYGTGVVRPAAVTELIEQFLRTGFVLGLLVLFLPTSPEKMVGLILLGMIGCEVYSAATQSILFRRHMGPRGRLSGPGIPQKELRSRMAAIAAPVGFTALLGNLIGSANAVVVPRLLVQSGMERSEAMEHFGVMFGMTLPMLFLPTAFLGALNLVLAPKLAESQALGRREEVRRRIRRAIAAANLILIPLLALLAVLGPGLGTALYKDPRAGDHMALLALGVLFACWQTILAHCLSGLDYQSSAAKIALFTDAIQLGITCLTVGNPKIGLLGFVWGYLLTSALGAYLSFRKLAQKTGLRLAVFDWFVAPILASTLTAACARLLYFKLLGDGLSVLISGGCALLLGLLLYLVTLQAQGVSLRWILEGEPLKSP